MMEKCEMRSNDDPPSSRMQIHQSHKNRDHARACDIKCTRTTKAITKATHQTPLPKINEYPSYPHTSGRMGATANDSPHQGLEVNSD